MNVEEIKKYRARVGIAQNEIREEVKKQIEEELSDPDFNQLFRAVRQKNEMSRILVEWLRNNESSVPEEALPLVRWIERNESIAFNGYNPYLSKLASKVTFRLREFNLLEKLDKLVDLMVEHGDME